MIILDTLVQHGIVKKEDVPDIIRRTEEGTTLEDALIQHGISKEDILRGRGIYYNLPIRDLKGKGVPFDILKYIPEDSASYYHFAPIGIVNGILEIGILDPENIEARDALQFIATKVSMPFKIYLISRDDFRSILENYRGLSGEVTKALSELEVDISDVKKGEIVTQREPSVKETEDEKKRAHVAEDAPVAKITAVILRHATEGGASDVHIEHMGEQVRVRFRVDGELYTSLILPVNVHSSVVARIKILANLKLDEKRKPQDGRFSARIDGRKIDFRVSTFPAYYGEKVVMRILDTQKGIRTLAETGFRPRDLALVRSALARPYGIILITGPTGSGKSTTLYSMLNELDKETRNIISLEDPVEYNIAGINQSQVRPEIGYTFANGLRTTLRQDPDIIMVGEIRDKETAQLAIQAALTGHLVFSTLHTNNAIGAIPRLVDMGVDPYLIAPTLVLSIAQRLVRTIAPGSESLLEESDAMKIMVEKQFSDLPTSFKSEINIDRPFYEAKPTEESSTGMRGRVAVFEMFPVDKEIERLILAEPTEPRLWEAARKKGMLTMKEDAMLKCMDKIVPFQEIGGL
ncbi:MAG: type II secretion system protein E [Candidatus Azambacteria bacterium GW2011_GWA1_44_9]|uniref:Type II secretion system protein E n=1 Tax=Candidatus Azambacteria bacterium GW2011_GWA1_44_9 TaxID=1618610 RepID=A0A0G1MKN9_9BACT|nr:MAG: type II secretion system protein E [Candidatus Azambacteria bacterium GW2011_GWA1_44_9]